MHSSKSPMTLALNYSLNYCLQIWKILFDFLIKINCLKINSTLNLLNTSIYGFNPCSTWGNVLHLVQIYSSSIIKGWLSARLSSSLRVLPRANTLPLGNEKTVNVFTRCVCALARGMCPTHQHVPNIPRVTYTSPTGEFCASKPYLPSSCFQLWAQVKMRSGDKNTSLKRLSHQLLSDSLLPPPSLSMGLKITTQPHFHPPAPIRN